MMLAKGPPAPKAPAAQKSHSANVNTNAYVRKQTGLSTDERVDLMMSYPKFKKSRTITKRLDAELFDF